MKLRKIVILLRMSWGCDIISSLEKLEGYSHTKSLSSFNQPSRKKDRAQLYRVLCQDLKLHGYVLDYDRYVVLKLLIKKLKEGGL